MSSTATITETSSPETIHAQEQDVAIKNLNPYICLNSGAEKAIHLYQSALGAKIESLQRYGETGGCGPVAPEHKSLIVHAALRIGTGVVMLTDTTPDRPVPTESNVSIALDFADQAAMAKAFEALAAGGTVVCPIQDSFWGAKFGVVKDAHGVGWMFNCQIQA